MTSNQRPASRRWGIILAGGSGVRMQPFIQEWLGEERPKQYCTFTGSRSMIDHTLDRALALVPADQMLTVVAPHHHPYIPESVYAAGRVIEQPREAGSAPGVFLPLAHIMARDPSALVVILPSDHFIFPESRFCTLLERAFGIAAMHSDSVVILAAEADRPETDYGWITKLAEDSQSADGPLRVEAFHEKPSEAKARQLLADGGMWSTMITVARAATLWQMGHRLLPKMMDQMDNVRRALAGIEAGVLPPVYETLAVDHAYNRMPTADFSKDLLESIAKQILVLPMRGLNWCDWGRPHRVEATLHSIGKRPHFHVASSSGPRRHPRVTLVTASHTRRLSHETNAGPDGLRSGRIPASAIAPIAATT